MKKLKLFGVIASMLMVLVLVACGSADPVNEEDLFGVWCHGTGDHLGRAISALTGECIEFRDDGLMSTASEQHHLFSERYNNSNLYTFSEPNVITIGNEEYEVSIDGARLIIERDGSERIFQSVD